MFANQESIIFTHKYDKLNYICKIKNYGASFAENGVTVNLIDNQIPLIYVNVAQKAIENSDFSNNSSEYKHFCDELLNNRKAVHE